MCPCQVARKSAALAAWSQVASESFAPEGLLIAMQRSNGHEVCGAAPLLRCFGLARALTEYRISTAAASSTGAVSTTIRMRSADGGFHPKTTANHPTAQAVHIIRDKVPKATTPEGRTGGIVGFAGPGAGTASGAWFGVRGSDSKMTPVNDSAGRKSSVGVTASGCAGTTLMFVAWVDGGRLQCCARETPRHYGVIRSTEDLGYPGCGFGDCGLPTGADAGTVH